MRLYKGCESSPCSHERSQLILAQLRDQLCEQGHVARSPQPVGTLGQMGQEQTPVQRISFNGLELDSVNLMAYLREERVRLVLNCLNTLKGRTATPLKQFETPGANGILSRSNATRTTLCEPVSALALRPSPGMDVAICRQAFSPWSDPAILRAGVPLVQVSRHAVFFRDTFNTG